MPKSKHRKKKPQPEEETTYVNPLKQTWGKVVVMILVVAFLLGLVATTVFIMYYAITG